MISVEAFSYHAKRPTLILHALFVELGPWSSMWRRLRMDLLGIAIIIIVVVADDWMRMFLINHAIPQASQVIGEQVFFKVDKICFGWHGGMYFFLGVQQNIRQHLGCVRWYLDGGLAFGRELFRKHLRCMSRDTRTAARGMRVVVGVCHGGIICSVCGRLWFTCRSFRAFRGLFCSCIIMRKSDLHECVPWWYPCLLDRWWRAVRISILMFFTSASRRTPPTHHQTSEKRDRVLVFVKKCERFAVRWITSLTLLSDHASCWLTWSFRGLSFSQAQSS